jgi:hypothetical protein
MGDWIETTDPPGIWVYNADQCPSWKWYPPVKDQVLEDFDKAFSNAS